MICWNWDEILISVSYRLFLLGFWCLVSFYFSMHFFISISKKLMLFLFFVKFFYVNFFHWCSIEKFKFFFFNYEIHFQITILSLSLILYHKHHILLLHLLLRSFKPWFEVWMKHNEKPRRLFSQPKGFWKFCMDEFEIDDIMKESWIIY